MLRVTVTREQTGEAVAIGEVVIGKFAGTEQRGGYAARVYEPPSRYSNGTDACFTVRGHERYQPAMALVASVLAAWREGRIDAVGDGVQAALIGAAHRLDEPTAIRPGEPGAERPAPEDPIDAVAHCRIALAPALAADPALAALVDRVLVLADRALAGGRVPEPATLTAATALLGPPAGPHA